jgi:protein-disulfide isomerase
MGASIRLIIAALAVLSLAACGKAAAPVAVGDDMSMGSPTAKVTLVEYASVACPICAEFNKSVFPEFKKKYVDTGKVRYVAREALTGNPTLAASGFLLARCAGAGSYFKVTDAVYRAQDQIYEPNSETVRPDGGRTILLGIAKSVGLNEDQFTSCLSDEKGITALNDRVERYSKRDGVDATPTFVLNGKPLKVGLISMAELDAAIQPLLKPAG